MKIELLARRKRLKETEFLSAYILPTDVKIWIITEAADNNGQRAATTELLPEEY